MLKRPFVVSQGEIALRSSCAAGYAHSFSTLPQVLALEFQVVRKVFDLRLQSHTVNAVSWYRSHDCK